MFMQHQLTYIINYANYFDYPPYAMNIFHIFQNCNVDKVKTYEIYDENNKVECI